MHRAVCAGIAVIEDLTPVEATCPRRLPLHVRNPLLAVGRNLVGLRQVRRLGAEPRANTEIDRFRRESQDHTRPLSAVLVVGDKTEKSLRSVASPGG